MDTAKHILDKQEIKLAILNMLNKVIEKNIPYKWVRTVEPFPHPYKYDKISYDYSGEVERMSKDDFQELVKELGTGDKFWYSSELDELLNSIYIDQWTASYESNCGKYWITYNDLLQEEFHNWKYDNFELYDEETEEDDEMLDIELDEVLEDFIKNTSIELFCKRILKKWDVEN